MSSPFYDQAIFSVAKNSLDVAVSKFGNGGSISTTSHAERIDSFQNVTTASRNDYLTNVLKSGYEEASSNERKMKTQISWVQLSCICMTDLCDLRAAIDMLWVTKIGGYTVTSPILLLGEDGDYLDCLSQPLFPSLDELELEGCSWIGDVKFRTVTCIDDNLENLKFVHKETGLTVGRSLKANELFPSNADFIPTDVTFEDIMNSSFLTFPNPDWDFLGVFAYLNDAKNSMAFNIFDTFFNAFIDYWFEISPSKVPLSAFIRQTDYFSNTRLKDSVYKVSAYTQSTVNSLPLMMDIRNNRPEVSPTPEVWSGVTLLTIAAGALGVFLSVKPWKQLCPLENSNWFVFAMTLVLILVPTAAFFVELVAYFLRWKVEHEQNSYSEAMVSTSTTFADRFFKLMPYNIGIKGTTFVVTIYSIQESDESSDLTWLFIFGLFLSLTTLFSAYFLAPRYNEHILEGNEDRDGIQEADEDFEDDERI